MRVVNETIKDRVSERWIADYVVPLIDWNFTCNNC